MTDVADLLVKRGVIVGREVVRLWDNRFDLRFAKCGRRDLSHPNDQGHLDTVVISIGRQNHWLGRAID